MDAIPEKLGLMKNKTTGYWSERILTQLEYGLRLSLVYDNYSGGLIEEAVEFLYSRFEEDGTITKNTALQTENMIKSLSEKAKSLKVTCVAHAHLDMNWAWSFAETVAITLDTFRTMLNLMKEYPEFTFSQSQASVYKIVEDYDPDMLEEIKERVKEGRWEITASTWVETDKNMPNGESLAHHILYTKEYISNLFNICPDSLKIDFEPDTFGHSLNVPEILSNGGIKYYYHCRGYDKYNMYKWMSPSGKSVIVYREPFWYIDKIKPNRMLYVPEFCAKNSVDTMLEVYGVGDHGGGPTRADIERLIDMMKWPVFPSIKFGTFIEYFNMIEQISDKLPIETNELNFIFTGCYTSQSRIKMSNRISEAKMHEAEAFSALSTAFAGGKYQRRVFAEAWKKILFNHFHDILPGSCVIDSREYAMGQFQQVLAAANTETSKAFNNIAAKINTSLLKQYIDATTQIETQDAWNAFSEGAGVGFGVSDFGVPKAERGKGKNRIFHFFNTTAIDRQEPVEIVVWDWPGNKNRIVIKDAKGNILKHQLLTEGDKNNTFCGKTYWGHSYIQLLVDVKMPAYGYSTLILSEKQGEIEQILVFCDPRVEKEDVFILENNYVRICFDTKNASITSMIDKASGKEMVPQGKPAGIFRLIEEDDGRRMTSWRVGRYMNVHNINSLYNVKITGSNIDSQALRQWINYEIEFNDSKLKVMVYLDHNSTRLNYKVECDWQEKPVRGKFVPQLSFYMPVNYKCKCYKYDIPFGTIERNPMDMDVPANSWMAGMPEKYDNDILMLITDTKYGFRGFDDSLAVSLIRSSYDPDPYPELGIHNFNFALEILKILNGSQDKMNSANLSNHIDCVCKDCDSAIDIIDDNLAANKEFIKCAHKYNYPIHFISGTIHEGSLPLEESFISVKSGNIIVSSVKMPEICKKYDSCKKEMYDTECTGGYYLITDNSSSDKKKIILRVYETEGTKTRASIRFKNAVSNAWFVDINEKPIDCGKGSNSCENEKYKTNESSYIKAEGSILSFDVDACSIATICVEFAEI